MVTNITIGSDGECHYDESYMPYENIKEAKMESIKSEVKEIRHNILEVHLEEEQVSCSKKRTAKIRFINKTFHSCTYNLIYQDNSSFDDWMFLDKVIQKIKELDREFREGGVK